MVFVAELFVLWLQFAVLIELFVAVVVAEGVGMAFVVV